MAATALATLFFFLVVELGGAIYFFVQNRHVVYLNRRGPAGCRARRSSD